MKYRMPALLDIQHRKVREVRLNSLNRRWANQYLVVRANNTMQRVPFLAERVQRG